MNKRILTLVLALVLVLLVVGGVGANGPSEPSQGWDTQFISNTEPVTVPLGDQTCTCIGGTAIPEEGAGRHPATQFLSEGCKNHALMELCSEALYGP